jgi:putative restriction endonuclease
VPRLVKELYGYACQICGVRIETVAGVYAEGAHLVALGHDGDDHTSNVLCLCPNHHVMLDHGSIALTDSFEVVNRAGDVLATLTVRPEHGLNPVFAREHRRRMGFP